MRPGKCYFQHILIPVLAIGALFGSGCKRYAEFDNNNVVQSPYGLYFSDVKGTIYNTNDGKAFRYIFPGDGVKLRSLTVSGNNIAMSKYGLFPTHGTVLISEDGGLNFNPKNSSVAPYAIWPSHLFQDRGGKSLYVASLKGKGVEVSPDHGITWNTDAFDPNVSSTAIESFTQIKNGNLYAIDNNGPRIFERTTTVPAWTEKTPGTALPNGGAYFLASFNNTIIAASSNGGGVYGSTDGMNWTQYAGIPAGQKIFSAAGVLDRALIVGTDSAGVYRLNGTTFEPSNNGLQVNTTVYDITGKEDVYKNGTIRQYVYIATSKGLYSSVDLGKNWIAIRPGDMRVLH